MAPRTGRLCDTLPARIKPERITALLLAAMVQLPMHGNRAATSHDIDIEVCKFLFRRDFDPGAYDNASIC
jgi:hypothetical protein